MPSHAGASDEFFKCKSDAVLEQELRVLLTMSNGGGVLSNDIINELDRRAAEREKFLKTLLSEFVDSLNEFELENEACLQFELAFYLRNRIQASEYKVQLEKNVGAVGVEKNRFRKKEMDIFVYNSNLTEKYCIELKVVQQGAIPQRMYEAYKDVQFLEQLRNEADFNSCYLLFVTCEQSFWRGKATDSNRMYRSFRGQNEWVVFNSIVKNDCPKFITDEGGIILEKEYKSTWGSLNVKIDDTKKQWKYFILEI